MRISSMAPMALNSVAPYLRARSTKRCAEKLVGERDGGRGSSVLDALLHEGPEIRVGEDDARLHLADEAGDLDRAALGVCGNEDGADVRRGEPREQIRGRV